MSRAELLPGRRMVYWGRSWSGLDIEVIGGVLLWNKNKVYDFVSSCDWSFGPRVAPFYTRNYSACVAVVYLLFVRGPYLSHAMKTYVCKRHWTCVYIYPFRLVAAVCSRKIKMRIEISGGKCEWIRYYTYVHIRSHTIIVCVCITF